MSTLIDRVADLLYPESGPATADIKFFCAGDAPSITADDLAEVVHRALLHVRNGTAQPIADLTGY